jgi:hypothetical protein
MMLRYSLKAEREAVAVEAAVAAVLDAGWRTGDIAGDASSDRVVGTKKMGDLVVQALEQYERFVTGLFARQALAGQYQGTGRYPDTGRSCPA